MPCGDARLRLLTGNRHHGQSDENGECQGARNVHVVCSSFVIDRLDPLYFLKKIHTAGLKPRPTEVITYFRSGL